MWCQTEKKGKIKVTLLDCSILLGFWTEQLFKYQIICVIKFYNDFRDNIVKRQLTDFWAEFKMKKIVLSLLKRPWLFIYLVCFIAFLCQLFSLIGSYVHPSQTVTSVEKKDLNDIPFPVLFKICIKPGFDREELLTAGYLHAGRYFLGESRFNGSIHGWAGHLPDGRVKGNVAGRVCLKTFGKSNN